MGNLFKMNVCILFGMSGKPQLRLRQALKQFGFIEDPYRKRRTCQMETKEIKCSRNMEKLALLKAEAFKAFHIAYYVIHYSVLF